MKKLLYILPEASETTHMKYNVEFVTALAKERGVEVYLILERGWGGGGAAAQSLQEYLKNLKEKTGVKYIRYTGTNILRIPKLKIFLLEAMFYGFRNVYVHYSFVGAIYASLNPFFKTFYWNCGIPWQYKRPFVQDLYETFAYKVVTHFVTGANILVEKYADYYKFDKNKAIVIPNWIDVVGFRKIFDESKKPENILNLKKELKINSDHKILFFNQRLAERKGAHYIKKILEKTSSDVVMIITNDGPYKEKLITELKENNLFERVRLLGRVPNKKVVELLSITDIYILPSEEEGMSHSLMEAMCAAVPAVSFDVGGTKDMYPEEFQSLVLPEKDITGFVEQVSFVLQNKEEKERVGNALYQKVQEYDKEKVLDIFCEKILACK